VRAVVLDGEGRELARAEGPGAVASEREAVRAGDAVAAVVRQAAAAAAAALPLDALWAGLAGAGREAARQAVEQTLGERGLARRVRVGTDVEAAFQDAFGEGPGILLLAGTGSVAWARSADGRDARVGGWGQLVGDEGSGWALGIGALRAALRAADGRGGETTLTEGVRRTLDLPLDASVDALVSRAASASKAEVAALAPVVAAAAAGGDALARALLVEAAAALVEHVTTLRARVSAETSEGSTAPRGPPDQALPAVALAGGLLDTGGVLRAAVIQRLHEAGVEVLPGVPDAVRGAGRRALEFLEAKMGPDA
jgi:N-acetylglucosamine kinase-like BadF-type ATPase